MAAIERSTSGSDVPIYCSADASASPMLSPTRESEQHPGLRHGEADGGADRGDGREAADLREAHRGQRAGIRRASAWPGEDGGLTH